MRKADRAIEDEAERLEALLSCDWLTLSLADEDGAPYCVPLNFGAEKTREGVALYFHCAREGKKLDLLRADGRVAFCAARLHRVFNKGVAPCGWTSDYTSVCGRGEAEILRGEAERLHGLKVLMRHYTEEQFSDESFAPRALALCEVVRVRVREWTGKRLVRPE